MEKSLFVLPGWEEKISSFDCFVSILRSAGLRIKVVDFPFFYEKTQPNRPYNLDDFVKFALSQIKKKKKKVIVLGHSFGGRVAIKLAANYPEKIDHLILCNAAGIKRKSIKRLLFWLLAKIGQLIFSVPPLMLFAPTAKKLLYRLAREKDYFKAKGNLRETFKNIIAEDLTPLLPKIEVKTLIIWGEKDRTTPLKDGQLMNKLIPSSQLVILKGAGHSLQKDQPKKLAKKILKFLTVARFVKI